MFKTLATIIALSSVALSGCALTMEDGRTSDSIALASDEHQAAIGDSQNVGDFGFFTAGRHAHESNRMSIQMVNMAGTGCTDEISLVAECYADRLDFSGIESQRFTREELRGLFAAGRLVVEGWLEREVAQGQSGLILVATDAYVGATDEPARSATLYAVSSFDVECVRAPCPTHEVSAVNIDDSELIHELDLAASGADPRKVKMAQQHVAKDMVLVAGDIERAATTSERSSATDGSATLVADNFFTRID